MGKYGNISVPLPETYLLNKEAVLKAVKEGTIDETEGKKQVLAIQREANLWIVMTNGGYSLPTKRRKRVAKKMVKVHQYLEEMKTLLAEAEKAPEGEEIDQPSTPMTPAPEPIDTPSRDPIKPVDPEEDSLHEMQSELMMKLQPILDEALSNE